VQIKLHRRASEDRDRGFNSLLNLAADPDFLPLAWDRLGGNAGARTAGIDPGHLLSFALTVSLSTDSSRAWGLPSRRRMGLARRADRPFPRARGAVAFHGLRRQQVCYLEDLKTSPLATELLAENHSK
jgi:hypothetical protein